VTVTELQTRLKADLLVARRERRAIEVSAVRSLLAALANAEAVSVPEGPYRVVVGLAEAPRRVLSDADVEAIVAAELEERRHAIDAYEASGRDASPIRAELAVLQRYRSPG
jgi:uncharacterized protein